MHSRRDILTLAALATVLSRAAFAQSASLYDYTLDGLDGNPLPLDRFRGKVMLIVNTASKCAFTPQYEALEKLWRSHAGRGLVVVGIPSNDFGGQEPGSLEDIRGFCTDTYNVSFPMASKTTVVGAGAHPLYRAFQTALANDGVPGWNFHKILVGRDGVPIAGFESAIKPDDGRITLAIENALAQPAG